MVEPMNFEQDLARSMRRRTALLAGGAPAFTSVLRRPAMRRAAPWRGGLAAAACLAAFLAPASGGAPHDEAADRQAAVSLDWTRLPTDVFLSGPASPLGASPDLDYAWGDPADLVPTDVLNP